MPEPQKEKFFTESGVGCLLMMIIFILLIISSPKPNPEPKKTAAENDLEDAIRQVVRERIEQER